MSEDAARVITVSRDALRADLSEMELRLRTYLDAKLEAKAAAHDVVVLTARIDAHDRGELAEGIRLQINAMIEAKLTERIKGVWSLRANKGTFIVATTGFLGILFTVFANLQRIFG